MLLKFAVKDFLEDRELRNVSEKTLEVYKMTVEEFTAFCTCQNMLDTSEIRPQVIKQYLLYCKQERKNKPTSLNHKLHNLKIFFNYLEEIDVVAPKTNPAKEIKYAKEETKINIYSENQIRQIVSYFRRMQGRDKGYYVYRDYAICVFLISTGVRLGELRNFKWKDIDFNNYNITVFGKKRQYSSLPMTEKLKKEMCEFKVYCEIHFKDRDLLLLKQL